MGDCQLFAIRHSLFAQRHSSSRRIRARVLQHKRKPLLVRLQINEGRRSAGRRKLKIDRATPTAVATRSRFGRGARHGPSVCTDRPLRARSPLGAPPRLWPKFLGLGFSTSGQVSWNAARGGVTRRSSCPSPADAPRAPVVMPADMMPEDTGSLRIHRGVDQKNTLDKA